MKKMEFMISFGIVLCFQLWMQNSRVIGFGGRVMGDDKAKRFEFPPETAVF